MALYRQHPFIASHFFLILNVDDQEMSSSDRNYERDTRDEQEQLIYSNDIPELESQFEKSDGQTRRYWIIPVIIVSITAISSIIGTIAALTYQHHFGISSRHHLPLTLDKVFDGTFNPVHHNIKWVNQQNSSHGMYGVQDDNGAISLVNVSSNTTKTLVQPGEVLDIDGQPLEWDGWSLSPDGKFILFQTDTIAAFRYSNYANYYIHSLDTRSTHPLTQPTNPGSISLAMWSPSGHALAYVRGNDLYVVHARDIPKETSKAIRVTDSGTDSVFNAVTDWVYEEEIFNSHQASFWNQASEMIAYLILDESKVKEYKIPVYNPTSSSDNIEQYPQELRIKYPEPGTPNPLASLSVYSLINGQNYDLVFPEPREDRLIIEITWTSKMTLLVKETSRDSRHGTVVLFDFRGVRDSKFVQGHTVRDLDIDDGGWIDCRQSIKPIKSMSGDGYLDIVPNEGYNHIAFFKSSQESSPEFVTSGKWEVDIIMGVNEETNRVYFSAAYPTPIDKHILSVTLPDNDKINVLEKERPLNLTDISVPAKYSAIFNKAASFYVLNYDGPDVPTQEIRQAIEVHKPKIIETNEALNNTLKEYSLPKVIYDTIVIDNIEYQIKEVRPPQLSEDGWSKRPVLFQVYGGPDSQVVTRNFKVTWGDYLATSNGYITVYVDVQGTGNRGRQYRNVVRDNLGKVEAEDVIKVAKHYSSKTYVDSSKIGIWGWSYGGYLSAKVMEADSDVFSLGISVAPVTNWKLYDSVYTERYMSTPKNNPDGYLNSAVRNVTGFHNYALAHGTGDDNVHFANTAHLLDMFTENSIKNFRFRAFTDSNHSMGTRNAYRELMDWLTRFLNEQWKTQKSKGKKT
ncbi:hypothetical protein E3Q11_02680 [Wallemia mellicola]|nr:hypothetical protein E3Q11_02680 [Wallemia mellicola]